MQTNIVGNIVFIDCKWYYKQQQGLNPAVYGFQSLLVMQTSIFLAFLRLAHKRYALIYDTNVTSSPHLVAITPSITQMAFAG